MQIRISRHRVMASVRTGGVWRGRPPRTERPTNRPRLAWRRAPNISRLWCLGSLAAVCVVTLSACTHAAAPPVHTPIANVSPTATPIPPVLHAYSQVVQPLIRMSTAEAAALESKMRHDNLSVVGDECSIFGGDFQSAEVTMRGTFTPKLAMPVYYHANNGYRLLAVSTDECGLASDTNSKSEMRSAIADLRSGVSLLDYAYGLTKRWTPGS